MLWQFTPEEIAAISETGQLYISQVLGQTAVPMLEVLFRDITDEERAQIEKLQKQARFLENREKRSRRPNAKVISLKSVK